MPEQPSSDDMTRVLRVLRDIEDNLAHGYAVAALATVRAEIRRHPVENGVVIDYLPLHRKATP